MSYGSNERCNLKYLLTEATDHVIVKQMKAIQERVAFWLSKLQERHIHYELEDKTSVVIHQLLQKPLGRLIKNRKAARIDGTEPEA